MVGPSRYEEISHLQNMLRDRNDLIKQLKADLSTEQKQKKWCIKNRPLVVLEKEIMFWGACKSQQIIDNDIDAAIGKAIARDEVWR